MPRRMLLRVALAQFLGLTLWFSATAAAPAIGAELSLSGSALAWLTMAVQAGFVAGTLGSALLNLPDVINARRLFAAGCAAGAAANAAIPLAGDASTVILLRFATGVALACVYPPGLKIAAGWFLERRGTALGVVVGALTIGSAFPHLLAWGAHEVPWRVLMWISSALALAGGALVVLAVTDGPHVSASAPFDPHAIGLVVRNRGARLAMLGYLGHMWELYAMWTWIPVFAAAWIATVPGGPGGPARLGSLVAFVAIASGAVGCVVAGRWADAFGKARVAGGAMVVSGACAAAAGVFFGGPLPVLLLLAVVWGFAVVADSAQFTALIAEYSPRTHVGTAVTLQVCAGFLLTMVSMRLLPALAGTIGWQWAFLLLVPGPALGAAAMARFRVTDAPMSDFTALETVERALAGLTPGEKARLLQKLAGQVGGVVPGIDTDPAVCGGEACIARTRIPVWLLVRARQLGGSEASLLAAYPTLRAEDLVSAWAYAQLHAMEIAGQIAAHEAA